MQVKLLF